LVAVSFVGEAAAKTEVVAAKAQIESIGLALEGFRRDVGRYPTDAEELVSAVAGPLAFWLWDGWLRCWPALSDAAR
jgi:type II secretory pathway pseudopilin PulG